MLVCIHNTMSRMPVSQIPCQPRHTSPHPECPPLDAHHATFALSTPAIIALTVSSGLMIWRMLSSRQSATNRFIETASEPASGPLTMTSMNSSASLCRWGPWSTPLSTTVAELHSPISDQHGRRYCTAIRESPLTLTTGDGHAKRAPPPIGYCLCERSSTSSIR